MGLLEWDDECLTLCSKMVKNVYFACSEAFDVQLKDGKPSELVDDAFRCIVPR